MESTRNGMTQRMEEKRTPKANIRPSPVAHDMNGRAQAAKARMI